MRWKEEEEEEEGEEKNPIAYERYIQFLLMLLTGPLY